MPTFKKRSEFLATEQGVEVSRQLRAMQADSNYNTLPSYSTDGNRYPDNLIPFVDKHLSYLSAHPAVNPSHYMSNLRLMTRIK